MTWLAGTFLLATMAAAATSSMDGPIPQDQDVFGGLDYEYSWDDGMSVGLLFDSGPPVPSPYGVCGACFGWSSTYYHTATDFDFTARRFNVPPDTYATSFRIWWAYGDEGPHPNSANHGGDAADFSSITLDLYEVDGFGGPGTFVTNLTGTWTTLDAPSFYKEFVLDTPFVFTDTDYFVSMRAETSVSTYGATVLWLMCSPDDTFIDYENYDNSVIGSTGGWSPYTVLSPCPTDQDFSLQVVGASIPTPVPDGVNAFPDPGCLTSPSVCKEVTLTFDRADMTPVRGYSVTFELDNLMLCSTPGASVDQGPYLSGYCGGSCTHFEVIDNLDGSYTVDCAILGATCGPDSSGTLFTVDVKSGGSEGPGTLTVTDVIVRDCLNGPVTAVPGNAAEIEVDTVPPSPVADLLSTQVKTGNGSDGLTGILLSFTEPTADVIEVWRAPYSAGSTNAYPEYDDMPSAAPPTLPASYPPPAPWALTGVTGSPQTDEPSARGYWYYVVYSKDACGNVSSVSNMTTGTLNYHLGDVTNGVANGSGNNLVNTPDISHLGDNYGLTMIGYNATINYLDVGPTDDFSVDGLPETDDNIDFEDLILFAINFEEVSAPGREDDAADLAVPQPGIQEPSRTPSLRLVGVEQGVVGTSRYQLVLEGNGNRVQGGHAVLDLDGLEPIDLSEGMLLDAQAAEPFFASYSRDGVLVVDFAALGNGRTVRGDGVVCELVVPRTANRPMLTTVSLRSCDNEELTSERHLALGSPSLEEHMFAGDEVGSNALDLLGARPNPFSGVTVIRFQSATRGPVGLRIVDVQGRLIDQRVTEVVSPGIQEILWDGTDMTGQRVPTGIYLYELQAGGETVRGKVSLSR
ncbi:MAG: T9SS type A sorting domain-containing protein [Candidatus Eisenbacteria bacterium]|uniref:T9SS type A sorting domain-containing protein n=1 Tax=Eiseniibacteriota bacterium TaxID=2212470 RepID=A0A956NFU2_UNCEI|nr:T9SS type A sorting domain-containing protein [Candidatus Eisenbacteria bacterium]